LIEKNLTESNGKNTLTVTPKGCTKFSENLKNALQDQKNTMTPPDARHLDESVDITLTHRILFYTYRTGIEPRDL